MLLDAVLDSAARRASSPAISARHERLTYEELGHALRASARRDGVVVIQSGEPVRVAVEALAARFGGGVPLLLEPEARAPHPSAALFPGTAWLKATGGTTGNPRLVAVSEEQAHAIARSNAELTGMTPGAALVVTVPPWTAYGWNCWSGALVAGAEVRYVAPTAPSDLLDALADPRVTFGCTTPPVVRALARLRARGNLRRAPVITAAAAYPDTAAAEVLERHGIAVIDRYGCAEAGSIAQAREPGGPLWPAPRVELHFAGDPETVEVRGPCVALGIVGGAPFEGRFATGDLVQRSADGSFRLLGRADRVVRRMARAVDLDAVERALLAQPGIAHARVQARPGVLDVELVAQVVPANGAAPSSATLAARLGEILAPWERPSSIEILSTIDATKWRSRES